MAESHPLALITGGSSGIGAAFARLLAREGYHLRLVGRREERLRAQCTRLSEQYGVRAEYHLIDLASAGQRAELVAIIQRLPRLDALINNAGYTEDGAFGDIDWPAHRALLDVHITSVAELSHAALPALLRSRGLIINVASVTSWMPTPQSALYGPTKAFVRSFAETLALTYRRDGLRVQALCPGLTITDFHEKLGLDPQRFYRTRGPMRAWTADQVVRRSWRDLSRGRIVSVPGWNYRLMVWLLRHTPMRLLHWALGRANVARFGAD